MANKGFIIWLNRECFQAGPTRKVPSGEDRRILAARGFSQIINVHVVFETPTFWQQKRKLLSGRITLKEPCPKWQDVYSEKKATHNKEVDRPAPQYNMMMPNVDLSLLKDA